MLKSYDHEGNCHLHGWFVLNNSDEVWNGLELTVVLYYCATWVLNQTRTHEVVCRQGHRRKCANVFTMKQCILLNFMVYTQKLTRAPVGSHTLFVQSFSTGLPFLLNGNEASITIHTKCISTGVFSK